MNFSSFVPLISKHLNEIDKWRTDYETDADFSVNTSDDSAKFDEILSALTQRLRGNYPFHAPSYAGQMLKPPHPLAWSAYLLASTINPNNHALDGGPPTSEMEKEVIADIATLCGFKSHLGHLTSGGTFANLEALWIAGKCHPDKPIIFSEAAHYTHERMCQVLKLPYIKIPVTGDGIMDLDVLESIESVGTVVVTMGSTGLGLVEPLEDIATLGKKKSFRIHVDAAYGGFFKSLIGSNILTKQRHWIAIEPIDSIVIDPHKHGLQPYGCGSVIFSDSSVGKFYKHDSPYTYFSSNDLHLGEISLECSRAGASAAALWATLQLFPLTSDGIGKLLASCLRAAQTVTKYIKSSPCYTLIAEPDLDIVVFAPSGLSTSKISEKSKAIFKAGMELPKKEGLHLSLYSLDSSHFNTDDFAHIRIDSPQTTVLRSVFMKPEHELFAEEYCTRIEKLYNLVSDTQK